MHVYIYIYMYTSVYIHAVIYQTKPTVLATLLQEGQSDLPVATSFTSEDGRAVGDRVLHEFRIQNVKA